MISPKLTALALIDRVWLAARRARGKKTQLDTPGAGVQSAQPVEVAKIGDVHWPCFPAFGHSFWRAQEVTLFRRNLMPFSGRVLDLGCGDGIFGRLAGFPDDAVGVDYDNASLAARRLLLPEAESLWGDAGNLSLETASISACVSNSVFEHLPDLPACFREIRRVLVPGGELMFTMTLGSFSDHLRRGSGRWDAAFWLGHFGHNSEPTRAQLLDLMKRSEFEVTQVVDYQPESFSREYRRLISPAVQFRIRRLSEGKRTALRTRLCRDVEASLAATPPSDSACIFVKARAI